MATIILSGDRLSRKRLIVLQPEETGNQSILYSPSGGTKKAMMSNGLLKSVFGGI
jgi:hypothetical protein